jgi:hypothetical protein
MKSVDVPRRPALVACWVLAAGVGSLAACGGAGPIASGEPDSDGDGLPDALEAALVAQYRPYWFFDESEALRPISLTELARLGGVIAFEETTVPYSDLRSLLAAARAFPAGTLHLPDGPIAGGVGAPVYVDAVPVPAHVEVGDRRNLAWLHFWLFFGDDVKAYAPERSHRGDWEHVCVMAERDAVGERDRPPVLIHWHHHGAADVAIEADAWHADASGAFHPRAYVEAGGHAIYRRPGTFPGQHDDGHGTTDDPLDDPVVFMTGHDGQGPIAATEAAILRRFQGRWGQTLPAPEVASPVGPLVHNGPCDHDYLPHPTGTSFAQMDCEGL